MGRIFTAHEFIEPASAGIELFTTLLARELGLLVPEAVLVEVPARLHEQVFAAPKQCALLEQSLCTGDQVSCGFFFKRRGRVGFRRNRGKPRAWHFGAFFGLAVEPLKR